MGRQFAKLRVETATKTDRRIRLMNEIINGMKVIKMYTWEKPFAHLVHEARKEEIRVIRKTAFFRFGLLRILGSRKRSSSSPGRQISHSRSLPHASSCSVPFLSTVSLGR